MYFIILRWKYSKQRRKHWRKEMKLKSAKATISWVSWVRIFCSFYLSVVDSIRVQWGPIWVWLRIGCHERNWWVRSRRCFISYFAAMSDLSSNFTFAGMDTTSGMLARLLHLLSMHQDVQSKLRQEIVDARNFRDGNLGYDELVGLPYLDAVCRETLRLWVSSSFSLFVFCWRICGTVIHPFRLC